VSKIRVGLVGYGNLGRGVEKTILNSPDQELVAVFTRRDPGKLTIASSDIPVVAVSDLEKWHGKVDVLILAGGSATDLPEQGPAFARHFNTVDSFDTHPDIPAYYAKVDAAAKQGHHIGLISVGWDPGMFSINRAYSTAILPTGNTQTFWGKGVSQGHSDAVRRIDGVADAVQYTVPIESAVAAARSGQGSDLTTRQKHLREAYVVAEPGANKAVIEEAIKSMPKYFADYDTTVHFISQSELDKDHKKMPHGGFVVHTGESSRNVSHTIEYRLTLESNPEFTASVLVAYARAAYRMFKAGERGARTVLDVAPGLLSPKSAADLRAELL
jgi:diaminopimelate dehydrogenase